MNARRPRPVAARALLAGVVVSAVCMACAAREPRTPTVDTSAIAEAHRSAVALGDSLRVARARADRDRVEKDLLVREVHGYDRFMVDLQGEVAQIRRLEGEARALEPARDPLAAMEAERARILGETHAARLRLARLESSAERQGRELQALRDSLRAAADSVLSSSGERDSGRLALASVRVLVQELRARIDGLQQNVDSLTSVARALDDENHRLSASLAAAAARDSVVHWAVGTRAQLVAWRLARDAGGMPMTGWGRVLQLSELRDSTHFTSTKVGASTIPLAPGGRYRILSAHDPAALENAIANDGTVVGPLRIRDHARFWAAGRWLVVLDVR